MYFVCALTCIVSIQAVLMRELFNMWEFLDFDSVRLPLNPAIEIAGIDVKVCIS